MRPRVRGRQLRINLKHFFSVLCRHSLTPCASTMYCRRSVVHIEASRSRGERQKFHVGPMVSSERSIGVRPCRSLAVSKEAQLRGGRLLHPASCATAMSRQEARASSAERIGLRFFMPRSRRSVRSRLASTSGGDLGERRRAVVSISSPGGRRLSVRPSCTRANGGAGRPGLSSRRYPARCEHLPSAARAPSRRCRACRLDHAGDLGKHRRPASRTLLISAISSRS